MGSLCQFLCFSLSVVRHGIEDSILHKDTDGPKHKGGEEVNVDVVPCTVETPGGKRESNASFTKSNNSSNELLS